MSAGLAALAAVAALNTAPVCVQPTVSSLGAATLLHAAEVLGLRAFVTGSPECPQAASRCFGVHAHVVVRDGDAPVVTPRWFAEQVRQANRLFAEIGVGFTVVAIEPVAADFAEVVTRDDRDRLGRAAFSRGVVHVYAVESLADVDIPGGFIRGVHWRDRADTSRRWIILSSLGSSLVLAHELGHFFGLPHSTHAISIMNKVPALGRPAWSELTFHPKEYAKMAGRRDRMLEDGALVDRRTRG